MCKGHKKLCVGGDEKGGIKQIFVVVFSGGFNKQIVVVFSGDKVKP